MMARRRKPVAPQPWSFAGRLRAFCALFVLALVSAPTISAAGTLVALRTVPAGAVIGAADLGRGTQDVAGAITDAAAAVGLETRATVYAGSPVFAANLRPPALVERNERVEMTFVRGPLSIRTEGRALDRGGEGERIRVMNLASRSVVTAVVTAAGAVTAGR